MRYDFRKVQEQIDISGKTLREVQDMSGVHYTTISRALKANQASQKTALALTKAFGISMKDIQAKKRRRVA